MVHCGTAAPQPPPEVGAGAGREAVNEAVDVAADKALAVALAREEADRTSRAMDLLPSVALLCVEVSAALRLGWAVVGLASVAPRPPSFPRSDGPPAVRGAEARFGCVGSLRLVRRLGGKFHVCPPCWLCRGCGTPGETRSARG